MGTPSFFFFQDKCSWGPQRGALIIWFQLIVKHYFHKVHFSLVERVVVNRDPYEPPIQSPFNTLMVRGRNKEVLMEPWASQ